MSGWWELLGAVIFSKINSHIFFPLTARNSTEDAEGSERIRCEPMCFSASTIYLGYFQLSDSYPGLPYPVHSSPSNHHSSNFRQGFREDTQ